MTAPVTSAPAATPSQEDRLLAAAAHLAFLAGFVFVGPIAIYVAKRKESRFVASYAAQAAALQVIFGGSVVVSLLGALVLGLVAAATQQPLIAVATLLPAFALIGGGSLVLCGHLYAALRAWQGRDVNLPIAGALARAIQRADDGAAR